MAYQVISLPNDTRGGAPEQLAKLQEWLNDQADLMMSLVSIDLGQGFAVFEALDNPSPI